MIEVLHPGLYTSIQDEGRFGLQSWGVPIGGAMDKNAMHWANKLLNNPSNSAVLEMSFKGPQFRFHQKTTLVLCGAYMEPKINGIPIENNVPVHVQEKDLLQMGNAHKGCRTYMAVAGGIQAPVVLGSQSQCKGITSETVITKNKLIPYNSSRFIQKKGARVHLENSYSDTKEIKVYKGPEFNLLDAETQKHLHESGFTLSVHNSRMAYILKEKLKCSLPSMWTSPVLPGTVQCTPNGNLIVLMRDAQTTGGYPRVLQVSEDGLNVLAQKSTNDTFHFSILPLNE